MDQPILPSSSSDSKRLGAGCLIGIVIIAFLALLAVPQGSGGHGNARLMQARAASQGLITAIKIFQTEYNQLPVSKDYVIPEPTAIPSSGALLNVLMAENEDINPRKIIFFEPRIAKNNANGLLEKDGKRTLVDPWGQPYYILLDLNKDGKVPDPEHPGAMLDTTVIVFSGGPDGDPTTWLDNVKSWN